MTRLVRGQVVRADVHQLDEPKLYLVVSNNTRNKNFEQVLCARLTTTTRPARASIVELSHEEAFHGRVICDDVEPVWEDEVIQVLGALTPTAMRAVENGLMAALGITR